LRFAEYDGELHRLFCVLKMRFSDFDRTLHAYAIVDGEGIRVIGTAPRAEGLLTGLARPLNSSSSSGSAWPAREGGR
jgi:KaiC/GvpD/RAD55 family RecA-like ATPase